jgi:hypothetical protein
MLRRIAEVTGREPKWIDPDADEEDRQAAAALVEILRLHVRDLVRLEVERALQAAKDSQFATESA